MTGYGGETPYLLTPESIITVQSPAGTTSAAPVEIGDLFKVVGTTDQDGSGYRLAACADNDAPNTELIGMATVRSEDALKDISVLLLGGAHRITRLKYRAATGTPTVGQSVEIDGNDLRKVNGKTYAAGAGRILKVLTASTEVEVLL